MAGFEYRGQISGAQDPVILQIPIANSQTVKVGDAVYVATNGVQRITNSTLVLGVVAGIVDQYGIDLDNTSTDNYDGTWTSSSKTYVASDDNLTDKKVCAQVIADEDALFYNDADGDFTNPTDKGLLIKCADHDQIDEDTTSATVGQFYVWKLDPDGDGDASKCLVKIARSQTKGFEPET
jgi:hypothetical protein